MTESRLQILEVSDEALRESAVEDVVVPSDSESTQRGLQSVGKVKGFGEIHTDHSAYDDSGGGSDSASLCDEENFFDDDTSSNLSSGSDARRSLDYLRDQQGGSLTYVLMTK